jgi:hypothetical protein
MTTRTKRIIVAFLLIASGVVLITRAVTRDEPSAEEGFAVSRKALKTEQTTNTEPYAQKFEAIPGAEVVLDERFNVSDDGTLEIRISHADVVVETANTDQAEIRIYLDARDMEQGRAYFESMNFNVSRVGETVSVTTNPERSNWSWNDSGQAKITVLAVVPSRFNADLTTSHGDVDLTQIHGRLEMTTSHGDVEADLISGPTIAIRTSHGDIEIGAMESDDIRLQTAHGDVEITEATGRSITVRAAHGDIEVAKINGRADMSNSHGDIQVRFESLGDSYLRTSHGDIIIAAPSDLDADLDLRADRVRISSTFRFQGDMEKDQANGRLNDGGSRIEARTSHGHITLRDNN